ncbi:hypothetical protein [Bacillus pinisoli]|uniref:hypothetical protein n=1 Tax=Bacillus pinisoli TaxID=2901866 RepID=UPI001FF61200|nr:hypothetical protein [Bacillus pinisoli]
MYKISLIVLSVFLLILAGCGQESIKGSMTLQNQNGEEVSFPSDEPVVFFFMTTYT